MLFRSFYYGQKHSKELDYAKYWAEKICDKWINIDTYFVMAQVSSDSALINKNISVPYEHYTHENQKITVVSNRNMIMLSIAAAWAESSGLKKVFFGPHSNDNAIYPDCRPEFVEAVNNASRLGTFNNVEIKAPFLNMQKFEIAILGNKLGVDYSKTWSCYEGRENHCGKCGTCQERREAFSKANLQDPTVYEL